MDSSHVNKMFGINFSPYLDGQDPTKSTPITESQIRSRMQLVAAYTQWVRTFSMVDGMEKAGAIAHSLNLKVALGAWLGPETNNAQMAINQLNIKNLIAAGQKGEADLLIVGSEVLLRKDLSPARLVSYLQQVKSAVPGIPVAVADHDGSLLLAPAVMSAADIIFVNIYPYWVGQKQEWALFNVLARYRLMVAAGGGKLVFISETGWPSCGDVIGKAVPSLSNAVAHTLGFLTMAKTLDIPGFYFEAFDESWKATHEGPQGACWGMWDKTGDLKLGNNVFFKGGVAPNTWSGLPPVEGPGAPSIVISSAPSFMGPDTEVSGRVLHVSPDDHHLCLYVYADHCWFMKPTSSTPYTIFQPDGSWHTVLASGGQNSPIDKIRVYLFPGTYVPPKVINANGLPAALELNALAKTEIYRTPHPLAGTIVFPANGAVIASPTTVRVTAQSHFGVTGVVLSVDGVVVSTDAFHPFEFPWDPFTLSSGDHTLSARVVEITGHSTETSIVVYKPY